MKIKPGHVAGVVSEGLARPLRTDAQRSLDALLQAAKDVFATSGVDAPAREIAAKARLGVGTVYRHFPQRSDLIAAVFRREIDACAESAAALAEENDAFDALSQWMQRFAAFFATKRGLAGALHSGEAAYEALPRHFELRLRRALQSLLASAIAAGQIRADIAADELLGAVASLSMPGSVDPAQAKRMIALLADCLRRSDARQNGRTVASTGVFRMDRLRPTFVDSRWSAGEGHKRDESRSEIAN